MANDTPTKLRISDIKPDELGAECAALAARHVGRLAQALSPGYEAHISQPNGDTNLGMTVADLAAYAIGKGQLEGPVEDYALDIVGLFQSPLDDDGELPAQLQAWLDGDVDLRNAAPTTANKLALVLVAALGREAIKGGNAVSPAQLALLAGISWQAVDKLISAGEIKATKKGRTRTVAAKEARRWLSGRGLEL